MPGINNLRFIKRTNLEHEQRLQKEWFREVINFYGIDLTYFRRFENFFDEDTTANLTYGEDSCASYFLSGDMVAYMEMMGDAFLLSKFGIETDGDCAIYFTIEDFNQQFKDEIGITVSGEFYSNISAQISGFQAVLSGTTHNSDISSYFEDNIHLSVSGNQIIPFSEPIEVLPPPVNNDLAFPNYYNYKEWKTTGNMQGNLSATVDASGNGVATGPVSGIIWYNTKPAELRGPGWYRDIAPQVGDFFRIDFDDYNKEEYQISRVHDRNLQTDGLNPLLGKYIWRCDCVRRDPSYEDVVGDVQEEALTTNKLEENNWAETISNDIFEYNTQPVDEIDKENSDSVYGDY